jgi:Leucine-rich repeat (LRR) protein
MNYLELFPADVFNIILLYSGNETIIQLQDYYSDTLKHITISEPELKLIDKNNYKYIKKFDCSLGSRKITDDIIKSLPNLTELNCEKCHQITDDGIQHLTRLTKLNCHFCMGITDASIQHLSLCKNLTKLNCSDCKNITDQSIQHLSLCKNLTELNCSTYMAILNWRTYLKITDNSIQHLTQLTVLDCSSCPEITDLGIKHLPRHSPALGCHN